MISHFVGFRKHPLSGPYSCRAAIAFLTSEVVPAKTQSSRYQAWNASVLRPWSSVVASSIASMSAKDARAYRNGPRGSPC